MFSAKILITLFSLIILGFGVVGGIYYYQNQTNPANNPLSALKGPITSEPASLTLEVSSPDDDTLSFESNIVISGKTSPKSEVLISSDDHDLTIEAKDDGAFSSIFDLAEGVNNLQITVFDKNGDERSVAKTVYYSKEKLQ